MNRTSADTRTSAALLAAAELALIGLSIAVILSFRRLFVDWTFFGDLAVFALVAHLLAIFVRRIGRGLILSAILSAVGFVLTASWLLYGTTLRSGLPTSATIDTARLDLDSAMDLFGKVTAPTEVNVGFILEAGLALWIAAFLADWAAFRIGSAFETMIPAATIFIFVTMFAAEQYQLESAALFAAATVVLLLLLRTGREARSGAWLGGNPRGGAMALVRGGLILGSLALLVGGLVGPRVPGAEAEAVLAWRDVGRGPGSRITISPLVNIQARLVELSDVEVFTVKTDRPDYWRLTSLDTFDGQVWESSGKYSDAGRRLPTSLPEGTETTTVRQEIQLENLGALWLPAAYEPSAIIDGGGANPIYEAASGTLVSANESSDGATYIVESNVPIRNREQIAAATDEIPVDIAERYLSLPDIEQAVVDEAERITAFASTQYEKALAIQEFFRDGSFVYDLAVVNGHSSSSIADFIFNQRRGYCEQFASAYAVMARSIGLPTRVAVGFTPGERDGDLYRVRGEFAHAWPEVYISGAGWLRFEPTPGRGAPGDATYTNRPAEQASPGSPNETSPTPTTTQVPEAAPTSTPAGQPDASIAPGIPASSDNPDGGTPTALRLGGIVLAAGVVVSAILAALAALNNRARRRRHDLAGQHIGGRIGAYWDDVADHLELLDLSPSVAETPFEFARRAAPHLSDGPALVRLAGHTTAARYSTTQPGPDVIDDAHRIATELHAEVRSRVGRGRIILWHLNPRPLLHSRTHLRNVEPAVP